MSSTAVYLALVFASTQAVAPASQTPEIAERPSPDTPPEVLDQFLARLGRLAQLFEDSALSFACEETITWREPGHGGGRQKFS